MKRIVTFHLLALLAAMSPVARAEEPQPSLSGDNVLVAKAPERSERKDRGAFLIGAKVGALFAEPFTENRLGPSFLVNVEAGYVLPVLRRGIVLAFDVGYTQPVATGTQTDPRIDQNGGNYSWKLTQRELLLGFTATYRFSWIGTGRVAPYVGIGPRLWFLQSLTVGQAGPSPISQSTEQSTRIGLSVPVGVDIGLGPGRIFGEAQLLWAPIDHRITGESSVGAITIQAGYRFWL